MCCSTKHIKEKKEFSGSSQNLALILSPPAWLFRANHEQHGSVFQASYWMIIPKFQGFLKMFHQGKVPMKGGINGRII